MRGPTSLTFEVARGPERHRSIRRFQRLGYSALGREDLIPPETNGPPKQKALNDRLQLIEARLGSETVGVIRWGVYSSVAGTDLYADSVFRQRAGLPSRDPSLYSRTDRLLIHPRYRRGMVLIGLARKCLELAVRAGIQYDLCWSEKSLSRLYFRLGYRRLPQQLVGPLGAPLLPQICRVSHFRDRWAGRDYFDRTRSVCSLRQEPALT